METRQRVLAFLRSELARLEAERDEVVLLLEVLAEPPGVSTGAENVLRESEDERLPVVEQLPPIGSPDDPDWGELPPVRPGYSPKTAEAAADNRRMLVRVLRERGAFGENGNWLTTQEMVERTGLARSTVSRHMNDMRTEGRMERALGVSPVGGRNPYEYRLLPFVEEREHHIDGTNGLVVD